MLATNKLRQADKKQPKPHKMGHPTIPAAIFLALLLLVIVIIYPGISPYSIHSAETSAAQQPSDNNNGNTQTTITALLLSPASAQPPVTVDPWLNGFPYRKPLSISGSTSALTDYQVNVTPYIYNETGLVGSWHFNEANATAPAYDSSGQGNTGTLWGRANRTTDGKFGNAMKFDGTDDYVEVSNSGPISPTEAITVEYWVYPQLFTGSKYQEAVRKSSDYLTGIDPSNRLFFTVNNFAGGQAVYTVPALYQWYHVVGTYDRVNQKLYVNGILRDSSAYTAAIQQSVTTLRVGTNPDNTENFNGTIDEVRIYNRTLSASEIQQHYQAGKARLDYADVRFTDSDGVTPLPFWMESDGKFWVKVPSIPTGGTTIYAYYGNPQANDAQNGTGTFEFFDDFSGGLEKWTVTGSPTSVSGELRILGATSWTTNGIVSQTTFSKPFILEFTHREDAALGWGAAGLTTGCFPEATSPSNCVGVWGRFNDAGAYVVVRDVAGADYSGTYTALTKYSIKLVNRNDGYDFYRNGVALVNSATVLTATYVAANQYSSGTYQYIDNVRVRKYASLEPSAVNGTEESLNVTMMVGSATNWTWKAPSIGEKVRSGGAQDWNWKPFQQYLGRYRKPISISNAGSALTDFQVNVTPYIYNETGLVGSWHFNEANATAPAYDSSGQGNTGTLWGRANRTTDGRFGNAMKFDGTDDYVRFSNITVPQDVTYEAWIRGDSFPSPGAVIVGVADDVTSVYSHFMHVYPVGGNRRLTLTDYVGAGNYRYWAGSTNLNTGTFYHVAAVQSGPGQTPTLYVNGVQETTSEIENGGTISGRNTQLLTIGRMGGISQWYFNGTIDEVKIYNRTLSASEIQSLYNATKARLDYADVRFTDSDGATLLPFWMESDGKFWVKVPSIPATTGTTIYAYYGNPAANDAQNATGTFIQWHGATSADFHDTNVVTVPFVYEGSVSRVAASSQDYFGVGSLGNDLGDNLMILQATAGTLLYASAVNNGVETTQSISGTWTVGTYYRIKVVAKASNDVDFYMKDSVTADKTLTTGIPDESMGLQQYHATGSAGAQQWSFVRKYASPDPSATQGAEEDSIIPQNITVPNGNAMNWTWYPS